MDDAAAKFCGTQAVEVDVAVPVLSGREGGTT